MPLQSLPRPLRAGAKCGLTSAPRFPQALQTNRGSISESLTSSGHRSAGIAVERLQRYRSQYLDRDSRAHAGQSRINSRLSSLGELDPDDWDLPPKPKWMRWKTCNSHEAKFDHYAVAIRPPSPDPSHCNSKFTVRDMIKNGLYLLNSRALDGVSGGGSAVLVLRDGKIHGGDSFFYYVGSYSSSEGKWRGEMTSQEHTKAPITRPMAGKIVNIGFSGTYTDKGAEAGATALVGKQSLRYDADLRLLIEF